MPKRKSASSRGDASQVSEFLATLDHPHKEGVQLIRELILSVDKRITEEIKWNAPSFMLGEHFATFRLQPPKNIQLVLHTGAKAKSSAKVFKIEDPERLLKWPAGDRAVLTLSSTSEAKANRERVREIVKQWIAQF